MTPLSYMVMSANKKRDWYRGITFASHVKGHGFNSRILHFAPSIYIFLVQYDHFEIFLGEAKDLVNCREWQRSNSWCSWWVDTMLLHKLRQIQNHNDFSICLPSNMNLFIKRSGLSICWKTFPLFAWLLIARGQSPVQYHPQIQDIITQVLAAMTTKMIRSLC